MAIGALLGFVVAKPIQVLAGLAAGTVMALTRSPHEVQAASDAELSAGARRGSIILMVGMALAALVAAGFAAYH